MRADLHIHTTASDGCWTPERLVEEVRATGIGLFAVADHDRLDSVAPTEALVRGSGLAFLRGVELSITLDGVLFHILGYGFELENSPLHDLAQANWEKLTSTNEESIRRLVAAGYPIAPEDYAAYEYDRTRGGWKSLNFLIDQGLCTDARDFFERLYVGELRPPWPTFPHPSEVARIVREAGGVPVLAHPGMSLRDSGVSKATLTPFLDFGIRGLECYSPYHDEATTCFCLEFCQRHDLLVTAGSDCHGGFVSRQLGVPIVDTAELRLGELEERIIRSA